MFVARSFGVRDLERLLSVQNLKVWFPVRIGLVAGFLGKERKNVRALDEISFDVSRGEIFCLVGESGCGKTTTGKAILRLVDATSGRILSGMGEEKRGLFEALERRIEELERALPPLAPHEVRKVRRQFAALQAQKGLIVGLMYPWKAVSATIQREKLEKTIAIFEERLAALRNAGASAIAPSLRRDRERVELLRTKGRWFTPRRARRLESLNKAQKEATYRLRRAEAFGAGTRKRERRVRRIERRLARMHGQERAEDPAGQGEVRELEQKLRHKEESILKVEILGTEAELRQLRARLERFRGKERRKQARTASRLLSAKNQVAGMRKRGLPHLELWELRQLREELLAQYDLTRWTTDQLHELRRKMQIIYQDPYESLNPKMSIFDIVAEPLLANKIVETEVEAEAVVRNALEDVGLRPATEFMFRYPHELSGGQRQRVGIAAALVVDPEFIVADEPVSMLDASVRTEILALLLDLRKKRNLTYLFITHDLGLAWIIADRLAVMYLGKIVEMGDGPEVIRHPRHPYTKSLISVVPTPNPDMRREKIILKGERPDAIEIPEGCRFHPRCPMAAGICGWNAGEVREDLLRLFEEDAPRHPLVRTLGGVQVDGPFSLQISTGDPAGLERYLRGRIETLGGTRPALAAVRLMQPADGSLHLKLHTPAEPTLRAIRENVWVACHLVEPEIPVGDASQAIRMPTTGQSPSSTNPAAR